MKNPVDVIDVLTELLPTEILEALATMLAPIPKLLDTARFTAVVFPVSPVFKAPSVEKPPAVEPS
jgi:hypothetical protein